MVSINYAFKEIFSKIVYYGPGLSGKTTNLQYVFKKVPKETRGELISLATDADRTLYFDFLPVNVGRIRGFDIKFQLYTVPGQVYYNATRKLVLRGVDGLVFVADSQLDKMDDNIESFKNLEENLTEYGYNLKEIPFVIQYNKRDLPRIAAIEQLQAQLNPTNVPYFEAIAITGEGVFATLKAISKLVIDKAKKGSSGRPEKPKPVVFDTSSRPSAESKQQAVEPVTAQATQTPSKTHPSQPIQPEPVPQQPAAAKPSDKVEDQKIEGFTQYGPVTKSTAESEPASESIAKPDIPADIKPTEKPAIVAESENMTNVVVSTTAEDTEEAAQEPQAESLEETTEHSVLEDDTSSPVKNGSAMKHHPDVLDADKIKDIYTPKEAEPELKKGFDEEATAIADPHQTGHIMAKPQMAESKKIKDKKKVGLFGWLRKKEK